MLPFLWSVHTAGAYFIAQIFILTMLSSFTIYYGDVVCIFIYSILKNAFGNKKNFIPGSIPVPDGLVIIPSLLRNFEDYDAMVASIHSCCTNNYPGDLVVIASIDGRNENPELYHKLLSWLNSQSFPSNIHAFIAYSEIRRGKAMAIDCGAEYMKQLVENKKYPSFPTLYFSFDADTLLNEHALEKLVIKLLKRNPLTGHMKKSVGGNICVSPDQFWQGWRKFFTVRGQIYLNVARQFLNFELRKLNWHFIPMVMLPGLLYVTWSDVLIQAPRFQGFINCIKYSDWLKWLIGYAPPKFSEYNGEPCPEGLCGNTDDTTTALIINSAHWEGDKLCFDAPRTPLHALGRLLWVWFIERQCAFEPESKGFTFVPSTPKGLWNQRVRWNSCRIECYGRFSKAGLFHWESAMPFFAQISMIFISGFKILFYYMIIPFIIVGHSSIIFSLIIGITASTLNMILLNAMSIYIETQHRPQIWRTYLSIPMNIPFTVIFGFMTMGWGTIRDVFLTGCNVKFVPESTLIKGKSSRIAIYYRLRRFFSLCIQSIRYGNVPFGWWWLGFREYPPYVDSGYKGWTSGKNSKYILK